LGENVEKSPSPTSTPAPATPPATPTPTATSAAAPAGGQGKTSDDRSRFYIALFIIVGLVVVLVIAVLQQQLTEAQQLAAIFSGWVTSIVAFYFYGQSNAQAQTQINNSAQAAAKSDQRAATAEKTLSNVSSMLKAHAAHVAVTRAAPTASDQVLEEIKKAIE